MGFHIWKYEKVTFEKFEEYDQMSDEEHEQRILEWLRSVHGTDIIMEHLRVGSSLISEKCYDTRTQKLAGEKANVIEISAIYDDVVKFINKNQ